MELGKSLIDKHELKLSKSELVMNVVKCCKQFFKSLLAVPVLIFLFLFFQYNNRLFVIEAKLIWPQKKLDTKLFQTRRYEFRQMMVVDLIEWVFIGKPLTFLREKLGAPDGDYYYNDSNYTYALTNKGNADWILTFISNDTGVVERIIIRKKLLLNFKKNSEFGFLNILSVRVTT